MLRYEVPEYSRLSLDQKKMLYYLSQAAQMGRDIIWDQNGRYNLQIRQLLEDIYKIRRRQELQKTSRRLRNISSRYGSATEYITIIPPTKFQPEFSQLSSRSRLANSAIAVYRCKRGESRADDERACAGNLRSVGHGEAR